MEIQEMKHNLIRTYYLHDTNCFLGKDVAVEGYDKFKGNGLENCLDCHSDKFSSDTIDLIALYTSVESNNEIVEEIIHALDLLQVSKIRIFFEHEKFLPDNRHKKKLQDALEKNKEKKIEFYPFHKIQSFQGNKNLTSIKFFNIYSKKQILMKSRGAFVTARRYLAGGVYGNSPEKVLYNFGSGSEQAKKFFGNYYFDSVNQALTKMNFADDLYLFKKVELTQTHTGIRCFMNFDNKAEKNAFLIESTKRYEMQILQHDWRVYFDHNQDEHFENE